MGPEIKVMLQYTPDSQNNAIITRVEGNVIYGGIVYRVSLNPSLEVRYKLRGTISALDPGGSGVMNIVNPNRNFSHVKRDYYV